MAKNLEISLLLDFYGEMLTDKQRDVLRMHFFEDMTFEEIGAVMGVSKVAAYHIKNRAVEQLKKYFHRPR